MTQINRKNKKKTLNILFQRACEEGNLNEAIYYLEGHDLDMHADIRADKDMALSLACENNHLHVIDYILSNASYSQKKSNSIKSSILENKSKKDLIAQGNLIILNHLKQEARKLIN